MDSQSDRGQVIVEALWMSLVLFSLLLSLTYFSFKLEEEEKKSQFRVWEKDR
ncbi:MAG: hypothetical protein KDD35_08745 [Bdellovibrionales bacterium]|nr:hypothetical protein [Bdellovibrionales bacterium]